MQQILYMYLVNYRLDLHYLWMISSCQTSINAKQSHHLCIQLVVKFTALVGHYHLRKPHLHENLLTKKKKFTDIKILSI